MGLLELAALCIIIAIGLPILFAFLYLAFILVVAVWVILLSLIGE